MTHYYEKNIVEIKNEYTTFLTSILVPLLYEGVNSIYKRSMKLNDKFLEKAKDDPDVEVPGVFQIFQICLKDIPSLNPHEIEIETNRIKERSKCSEYFDKLIRAVIKSNIILLTFNATGKKCDVVKDKYHEQIDTKDFIHKCYIECYKIFNDRPELFWHEYVSNDIKRNQREAKELIKNGVFQAIRKMLPLKEMLDEYLSNDYIEDDYKEKELSERKYVDIKKMIDKDVPIVADSEANNFEEINKDDPNSDNDGDIKDKLDNVKNMVDKKESEKPKDGLPTEVREKLKQPGYIDQVPAIKIKKENLLDQMLGENKEKSEKKHEKSERKPEKSNKKHEKENSDDSKININVDRSYSDKTNFFDRYMQ